MKAFKIIIVSLLLLVSIIMGCTSKFIYRIELAEIQSPDRQTTIYELADTLNFQYKDTLISISWFPAKKGIYFRLENVSDSVIKVMWDEVSYIDESKESHSSMHLGIKYTECDNHQIPSIIMPGSFITDAIIPCDNLYFSNKWYIRSLFPEIGYGEHRDDFLVRAKEHFGKTVQVYLPLMLGGIVKEYLFIFRLENIKIAE